VSPVRDETAVQRIDREVRERAARGEPEPGIYVCGRCGRDDARMYIEILTPADADRQEGLLNRLDGHMHRLPGWDCKGRLLCPCCSFPHLSGCPHQPLDPRCPVCNNSTLPTGSLPTGGPFVRCDGAASHPERSA
jgi:hypothetical protein